MNSGGGQMNVLEKYKLTSKAIIEEVNTILKK